MKSKTLLYSLAVIVLDIIAAGYVISSSVDPSKKEYENAIALAQKYEEQNLCEKAISAYGTACRINDDINLRMKIVELYDKGYQNGEFPTLSGKIQILDSTIKKYPNDTQSYDLIIEYYDKIQDYSSCAQYIRTARENEISSETVESMYEKVRHMYSEMPTSYDSIESFGSYLLAKKSESRRYYILDESGNPVYETDSSGDSVIKEAEHEYINYTYFFFDGKEEKLFEDYAYMSPLSYIQSNNVTYEAYFCKEYGNVSGANNSEPNLYSSFIINGVRQGYTEEGINYESINTISENRIALFNSSTGKYDMFDPFGEKTSEGYDFAGTFANSLIYVEQNGEKKILGTDGKNALKGSIDDVILAQGNRCSTYNRMFVKLGGSTEYEMIDSVSKEKIGFSCDNADLFLGGAAAFERNGRWGFVSDDGSVIIEPEYEDAKSFSNKLAAVKINGKWGFINEKNEFIVEPLFDDALYFCADGTTFTYINDVGWEKLTLTYME